jgi:NAD(P)-dependent dehydrogenase (short-subunit alcohol dehydrogenase family)
LADSATNRSILLFTLGNVQIGALLADKFSAAGHSVTIAAPTGSAVTSSARILDFDDRAADIEAEMASLVERAGPFDTVISAGLLLSEPAMVEALATEAWNRALRSNATWAFLLGREAVPVLRQAEAARMIFLVPEQVRAMPDAGQAATLASAAAVIGLTRTLALELGPEGITVNAIAAPLGIASDWRVTRTAHEPDVDDIAKTILFLLSPATGFITGSTLDVNGGRHML